MGEPTCPVRIDDFRRGPRFLRATAASPRNAATFDSRVAPLPSRRMAAALNCLRSWAVRLAYGLFLGANPWLAVAADSLLTALQVPAGLTPPAPARPVVVAIVDDGFRLSHRDLQPFLTANPREIPGNRVDDDGNGKVDDTLGWDVADDDADVSLPAGREEMFYHGTHLAGIVVQLARQAYGAEAPRFVRILPVKCLADDAERPYLKDGYKGIQYAVDAGADVILTAWGEAFPSPAKLQVLQSARERGAIVVASAGNFADEREQFPAAFPPALAVSAVDGSGARIKAANYGGFVDLVAPGFDIRAASSRSDTLEEPRAGTSMAAATVAASVAILKVQRPDLSPDELVACLKNTAQPVERFQSGEIFYGGKLGAGRLNLRAALSYSLDQEPAPAGADRSGHQGYLVSYRQPADAVTWHLRPEGEIKGFWFEPRWKAGSMNAGRVTFLPDASGNGKPLLSLDLRDWKERRFVPGRQVLVRFEPGPDQINPKYLIEYASDPIDQSTLYCRDTVQVRTERIIEDGSGPNDYSPRSSCKWQITAPEGKVVHIRFLEFDTEANMDWVYFFNGTGTHEKIMAVFSGPRIPPELTSWGRQVLLWFVTNDARQGRGWKAEVTFRDPPAPAKVELTPATPR